MSKNSLLFKPATYVILAIYISLAFKRFAGKFIPIIYWGMSLLFLYNYLWAKLGKVLFKTVYTFDKLSLTQSIQEVKESNYAVIFILVALFAIWDLNRSKDKDNIPVKTGTTKIEPVFPG